MTMVNSGLKGLKDDIITTNLGSYKHMLPTRVSMGLLRFQKTLHHESRYKIIIIIVI